MQEIQLDIARNPRDFFETVLLQPPSGEYGAAGRILCFEEGKEANRLNTSQTRISPIYTKVLAVKPLSQNFVLIRVISVFTRLRLNPATAWQAAVFRRKVFGKWDRRAMGPRADRA